MRKLLLALLVIASTLITSGWGVRGHRSANRAAVDTLPGDDLAFLRKHRDWIGETGPLPDSWRGNSEPHSKLFEDPNHGWFKEQFAFMKQIPRSRYEFVLRLYDEHLRIKGKDPEAAKLMNVRWTGTLPYAAIENYDRMKSAMRAYRAASAESPTRQFLAQDIAFFMGWMGHYTADGAMPLHNSIHHDGWQGENPKNYTRSGSIHARFETQFVDLIQITEADLMSQIGPAQVLADPFQAILNHLDDASTKVESLYQLDLEKAFEAKDSKVGKDLVVRQLSKAATLLRDLTYTAWVESGKPAARGAGGNPTSPTNPLYNPETVRATSCALGFAMA